ncbi:hypothetical protein [Solwaraspora sp. WMMD792]|uniref:hypothetical protein n=1 Tax=Solwaraspora sp. WMMD792 TaxID=3016099 RepID=UPI002416F39B|nr:hypothetical protein [Solwaraspora sp. WMMD792]MDG4773518.1 hypothetical protein [Solwaraspora sp. WMMD792]
MNESDLTSAFIEVRAAAAPPHRLTPQALIAAGQRARRRRRIAATAGSGLAVLVVVTLGIGTVNALSSGRHEAPIEPGYSSPTAVPEQPATAPPVPPSTPAPDRPPTSTPSTPPRSPASAPPGPAIDASSSADPALPVEVEPGVSSTAEEPLADPPSASPR